MPTWLFVRHHGGPDSVWIEVRSGIVEQALWVGFENAIGEAFADQTALPVAAVGVEAVTDNAFAVANRVGDDGDKARRHLGKVDIGVADGGRDRLGDLAQFQDAN